MQPDEQPVSAAVEAYTRQTSPATTAPTSGAHAEAGDLLDDFLGEVAASEDFDELRQDLSDTIRNRHAAQTRKSYDYWLSRLERWMGDPSSRFRFRTAAGLPLAALFPIDARSETLIVTWLRDITKGPTDPIEAEEWAEEVGPMAPATLSLIISALKARAAERQALPWDPSQKVVNVLAGLRRELREHYGSDRQAEPLLGPAHVAPIAKALAPSDSPEAARDRLILELHAVGLNSGEIARLTLSSLRVPRPGISAADHAANAALFTDTGDVGCRSLIVAGQNRRGGHSDPPKVLTLAEHRHLEGALDGYLRHRGVDDSADDPLLLLTAANPHAHVRAVLTRLAELANLAWRPRRNNVANAADTSAMRARLDLGLDWSGQLLNRRDHTMVLVGYLCALRRSELCALRVCDISFEHAQAIVTIRRSKSDQDQRGVKLPISRVQGGPETQAVDVLARWIELLATEFEIGGTDPLFPALNRHGDLYRRRGAPHLVALNPQTWSERLRSLAQEADVFGDPASERYARVSGHSLRRGYVTTALLAGQDPVALAKRTRHKNVQMLVTYADELQLQYGTDWAKFHFGDDSGLNSAV